jgi:hypothetical protein
MKNALSYKMPDFNRSVVFMNLDGVTSPVGAIIFTPNPRTYFQSHTISKLKCPISVFLQICVNISNSGEKRISRNATFE